MPQHWGVLSVLSAMRTLRKLTTGLLYGIIGGLAVGTVLCIPMLFIPEPNVEAVPIAVGFTLMAFWSGFFTGWFKDAW